VIACNPIRHGRFLKSLPLLKVIAAWRQSQFVQHFTAHGFSGETIRQLTQRQIARASSHAEYSLHCASKAVVVRGPGSDRKRILEREARLTLGPSPQARSNITPHNFKQAHSRVNCAGC